MYWCSGSCMIACGGRWCCYSAGTFVSNGASLGIDTPNQCRCTLSSLSCCIWKCFDGKFRGFSADLPLFSATGLFRGGRRQNVLGSLFIFKGGSLLTRNHNCRTRTLMKAAYVHCQAVDMLTEDSWYCCEMKRGGWE